MIMMPYGCPWPSPQLTGQADFWHPTGGTPTSGVMFAEVKEETR